MIYYVDQHTATPGDGSKRYPFRTIQAAADLATAGDEIYVAPGIYRESVNPKHAGTKEAPVVYRSIEPLQAMITGAELLHGWKPLDGSVWTASVPNSIFGDFNPYDIRVSGDWFIASAVAHLGDVYLNEKSMYEKLSIDEVRESAPSAASWDPEFSVYTWYAEVLENETVFYANFQKLDPNEQNVEFSVRPSCFYPQAEGIDYITLSGFTVCKAATQWAPPTALQEGMIGPHWSKGWIIEDCHIYESKCSGISLGKYLQKENNNKWLHWKYKDGTQTERDCILQAQREGWTKERIGHHIVRRCTIHDCGQTGIVGHLGGVFSIIEDNHIYNINNKQNLAGAEIGGIKMHAAIDVIFRRNRIHHCTRGLWLDWQAQGTRVTQNLFYDNTLPELKGDVQPCLEVFQALGEDIFVEVSHGPTLIDNNILLSARALKLASQGIAVVHNLIGGSLAAIGTGTDNGGIEKITPRYTPYHVPHRTEVAGFMTFLHGDVRFHNNVFVQQDVHPVLRVLENLMGSDGNKWDDGCVSVGTMRYDGFPTFEEWDRQFEGYCGMGSPDSDRYYNPLPVWASGNYYFNGAKAWEKETDAVVDHEHSITLKLHVNDDGCTLETNLGEYLPLNSVPTISTETLGMAFEPEQRYENPDGSPIVFDMDYCGQHREPKTTAGPGTGVYEGVKI
ncbi:MAG: right-handed parallel beta-helix repeat-containing protein [Eubacteriales bacterium]|nr:right-handed parallel beta-helix repeat-containing protein [Eubacteriales bacterium]